MHNDEFDYRKDILFYLGKQTICKGAGLNVYQTSSLAASLTGGKYNSYRIFDHHENLIDSVELHAGARASSANGCWGAKAVKGDGRSVDIFLNGKKIANSEVMVYAADNALDKQMPNGDYARNIKDYTWDDIEKLEEVIKQQKMESDNFTAAVADISDSDGLKI